MPQDLLHIFFFCTCDSTLPLLNIRATAYLFSHPQRASSHYNIITLVLPFTFVSHFLNFCFLSSSLDLATKPWLGCYYLPCVCSLHLLAHGEWETLSMSEAAFTVTLASVASRPEKLLTYQVRTHALLFILTNSNYCSFSPYR